MGSPAISIWCCMRVMAGLEWRNGAGCGSSTGAEQVIHQRQNDIEIAFLHALATVMQFMQMTHLADPRQARQRIIGGRCSQA
jgi:hypothetical protein